MRYCSFSDANAIGTKGQLANPQDRSLRATLLSNTAFIRCELLCCRLSYFKSEVKMTTVRCRFIDGPQNGLDATFPVELCGEQITLPSIGWIAALNGTLLHFSCREPIPDPKPTTWDCFVRSMYLRSGNVGQDITY